MILEIRLSNFFSIKEEVVLDLTAGNSQNKKAKELSQNVFQFKDTTVLKTVALYGANASGKSSIIKAIRFCCSMIFESHMHNENITYNFQPFKFEGYKSKPSTFLIRFVSNNVEYEYSFSLNQKEILTEELYYYPNNRRAKVFSRDETIKGSKADKYSFGSVIKRPLDVAENTSTKTLYISRASQMDREIGKEIFNFFHEKFLLRYIDFTASSIESLFVDNKSAILEALQIADSDIVDIRIKKQNVPVKSLQLSVAEPTAIWTDTIQQAIQLFTYHRAAPEIAFDFEKEESDGTKNLFFILLSLLDVVKNNKILLIDEIESSLHTNIVEFIIKMFHAGESSQLIYSTHNTNLLNLNKVRKDQIYFVNKKADASTDLYSLFDYKDFRENMDVEKAYLQGRFDAIPIIDDSVTNLKSMLHG
jgi:AAA15 family ATPase/GTPase